MNPLKWLATLYWRYLRITLLIIGTGLLLNLLWWVATR